MNPRPRRRNARRARRRNRRPVDERIVTEEFVIPISASLVSGSHSVTFRNAAGLGNRFVELSDLFKFYRLI